MKTKLFFIAIIIFLFTGYTPLGQAANDTCEVFSVDNISPYSRVEVPVRALTNQTFLGFQFDLTFKADSNSFVFCDSIQWTDWFWNNPANLYYSGDETIQYIKREKADTLQVMIMGLWVTGGLPPKDTVLATIHLRLGQIDIAEPDSDCIWSVGGGRYIRWISKCPWDVNDSIKVDTMLYPAGGGDQPSIRFVVSDVEELYGAFKPGYLIRDHNGFDSVKIEYSTNAGKDWNTVVASTDNDSEYLWSPIPDTPSDSCLIRITSKAENPISVVSDSFFTILPILILPNGGEIFYAGDSTTITWNSICMDNVKLEYSTNAGSSWNLIEIMESTGEYTWDEIPNTPSESCLFKISAHPSGSPYDVSDSLFTILADTTEVREEKKEKATPANFVLHQNYPNPFNPSTKIEFSLPVRASVRLDIYNIRGERVKRLVDETLPSGHWSITWNGEDYKGNQVASGVYFYRLKASQYSQTRKMVIVR